MRLFASRATCCCLLLVVSQLIGCGGSDESTDTASTETGNSAAADSGTGGGGTESSDASNMMQGSNDNSDYESGGSDGSDASYAGDMGSGSGEGYESGGSGYPGMQGSGDPTMMSEAAMASGGYESGTGFGGGDGSGFPGVQGGQMQARPSRPRDVRQWTKEHFLKAVEEKDSAVLQAIQARGAMSAGDPQFAQLMSDVVAQASGEAPSAAASPFGFPGIFGGGPGGGSSGQIESGPRPRPRPQRQSGSPPGGAALDPTLLRPAREPRVIESLEYLIGQSLLSYTPQATQGIRSSANNLQNNVNGSGQNSGSTKGTFSSEGQIGGPANGGVGSSANMNSANMNSANMNSANMNANMNAGNMNSANMSSQNMGSGYPGAGFGPGAADGGDYTDGGMSGAGGFGMNSTAGTLQNRALIETVVRALVQNNTPQAWQLIEGIGSGSKRTGLSAEDNTEIVLAAVFSAPEPNVQMAETLLASALNSAMQNPTQSGSTLRLLAAVNRAPADHFLNIGSGNPPPAPIRNSGAGFGGQPGMQGMGFNGEQGMEGSAFGGQPGMQGSNLEAPPGLQGASLQGSGAQPQMSNFVNAQQTSDGGFNANPNMANYGNGSAYAGAGAQTSQQMTAPTGYENGGAYTDGSAQGFGAPGFGAQQQPMGPPPALRIDVAESMMLPVARLLWAPSTASQVASFLNGGASIESAKDLLAFASTIPNVEVRHAIFNLLSKTHSEGAGELIRSGLFSNVARDPGLLAVLKSLPRQRPKPATNNAAAAPPGFGDSWTRATQDLVLSLRDRLSGVADDPALAFDGVLPVRLHKNATADRSIRVIIPGKPAEGLEDATPAGTKVYYSRVTVTPQRPKDMQEVVDHYEKRTKAFKREDRARGILWYDGVKVNGDGSRQTMDIIVQQVGATQPANNGFGGQGAYEGGAGAGFGGSGFQGGGPTGRSNVVQYTVEVIVVVTKDPSKAVDPAVATTSR